MIYRPQNIILSLVVQAAEFCLLVFDWLVFFFRRRAAVQRDKKVLILRLDAIGDFVIWLAAAKEIRALYSGYHITLLGNDLWTGLAERLPWFDDVWPLNRKRFFMNPLYRFRMMRTIQHEGFRIALNAVYSRDFLVSDVCIRASGASTRIGFVGNAENSTPWQKRIGDTWYTELIPSGPKHQLDQDADFARHLGSNYSARLPELPRFPLPKGFIVKDFYVIIPGAGHEMRQWPVGNFLEIARRVYNKSGFTAVLCGGSREIDLGRSFLNNADFPVMDFVGRTSLVDLAAVIAHARFLIGNDTGAIHIAVATSTPSVCIFGGAHPGRYIPYPPALNAPLRAVMHPMDCFNCEWHCVYDASRVVPCINNISVDDVWKEMLKFFKTYEMRSPYT